MTDPLGSVSQPVKFLGTEADETQGQLSPDGRWIIYNSNESTRGAGDVFVSAFPSGQNRLKVSTQVGADPRWSPDGRTIYFRGSSGSNGLRSYLAASFAVSPAGRPEVGLPRTLFSTPGNTAVNDRNEFHLVPARDGRFLVSEFDAAAQPVVNLVVNWQGLIPVATR